MDSVKQEHYTHSKLRERETAVLLLLKLLFPFLLLCHDQLQKVALSSCRSRCKLSEVS